MSKPLMAFAAAAVALVAAQSPPPPVAAAPIHWVRQIGSGAVNNDPYVGECSTQAVAPDPSLGLGGVLAVGSINGNGAAIGQTLSVFGATSDFDAFVAALDDGGNVLWKMSVGGQGRQQATAVVSDGAGGAFVAGWFENSMTVGATTLTAQQRGVFVMRVASGGAVSWVMKADGPHGNDAVYGIATDSTTSAVVVTGQFQQSIAIGSYSFATVGDNTDMYTFGLNPSSGAVQWAIRGGGEGWDDRGTGVCSGGTDGSWMVTGYFEGSPHYVVPATFGNAASNVTTTAWQGVDTFVIKVDASGQVLWAVRPLDSSNGKKQPEAGIVPDGAGGYILAGQFEDRIKIPGASEVSTSGSNDVWILFVDANANATALVVGGSNQDDMARSLAADGAGGALVAGYFNGAATFGPTSLTNNGKSIYAWRASADGGGWAAGFGNGHESEGMGITTAGSANSAFLAGYFQQTMDFGSGGSLTSYDSKDGFVMRFGLPPPPSPPVPPFPPSPPAAPPPVPLLPYHWVSHIGSGATNDPWVGDCAALAVANDGASGALVAGYVQGNGVFINQVTNLGQTSERDLFVASLSSTGQLNWALMGGGWGSQEARAIAPDGGGGAFVAGLCQDRIAITPGSTTWPHVGELTCAGRDVFVMHVNSSGVRHRQ